MNKALPLVVIGILIVSGFGAVTHAESNRILLDQNQSLTIKILLTEEERNQLDEFVEAIKDDEVQDEVTCIVNYVVINEYELDLVAFGEIIERYGYEGILFDDMNSDPIQDLLNLLIEIIMDRLGWVHEFLDKTTAIIEGGFSLLQNRNLPGELIEEITVVVNHVLELKDMMLELMKARWYQFFKKWSLRISIIQGIIESLDLVQSIALKYGLLSGSVLRFVNDVGDFLTWFSEEHWKYPIHVYGRVLQGFEGLADVTVTCRSSFIKTNEEGYFDFYVNLTPDDDSIPPGEWFGMHKCIITVEKDGIIKESPAELSYVFSDGGIYWLFIFSGKSKCQSIYIDDPLEINDIFDGIHGLTCFNIINPIHRILLRIFHYSHTN